MNAIAALTSAFAGLVSVVNGQVVEGVLFLILSVLFELVVEVRKLREQP